MGDVCETGCIVGIVLGSVAFCCCLGLALLIIYSKNREKRQGGGEAAARAAPEGPAYEPPQPSAEAAGAAGVEAVGEERVGLKVHGADGAFGRLVHFGDDGTLTLRFVNDEEARLPASALEFWAPSNRIYDARLTPRAPKELSDLDACVKIQGLTDGLVLITFPDLPSYGMYQLCPEQLELLLPAPKAAPAPPAGPPISGPYPPLGVVIGTPPTLMPLPTPTTYARHLPSYEMHEPRPQLLTSPPRPVHPDVPVVQSPLGMPALTLAGGRGSPRTGERPRAAPPRLPAPRYEPTHTPPTSYSTPQRPPPARPSYLL